MRYLAGMFIFSCIVLFNFQPYLWNQEYQRQIDYANYIESGIQSGIVTNIPMGREQEVYKDISSKPGYSVTNSAVITGGPRETPMVNGEVIDWLTYKQYVEPKLTAGGFEQNDFGRAVTETESIPILVNSEGPLANYKLGDKLTFETYQLPTNCLPRVTVGDSTFYNGKVIDSAGREIGDSQCHTTTYNAPQRDFKVVGTFDHKVNSALAIYFGFDPESFRFNYIIPYTLQDDKWLNQDDVETARIGKPVFLPEQSMQVFIDRNVVSGPQISQFEMELSSKYGSAITFVSGIENFVQNAVFQLGLHRMTILILRMIIILFAILYIALLNYKYIIDARYLAISNLLGRASEKYLVKLIGLDLLSLQVVIISFWLFAKNQLNYLLLLDKYLLLLIIISNLALYYLHYHQVQASKLKRG